MNLKQLFDSANKKLGGVPITTEERWIPTPISSSTHSGVEYRLYERDGITIKLSDQPHRLFDDLSRTRELFSLMMVELAEYEQSVKEFEQFAEGYDLDKNEDGRYRSVNTGKAFAVWQAAKQKYAP